MATEKRERCKAKSKRSGERCKLPAVPGYTVCRLHGANPTNPGKPAPKGNKRALVTGAREHIAYDTLTDEERALWHEIDTEGIAPLVNELKLLEIRERRMMQRIAKLAKIDFIQVRKTHHAGMEAVGASDWRETHSEATTLMIQRIELALTRVQATKQGVIAKLMASATDGTDSSFDALVAIFSQVRDMRRAGKERDDEDQNPE